MAIYCRPLRKFFRNRGLARNSPDRSNMTLKNSNRRDFLKVSGAAMAASAVTWNARSYAAILGANDRVKVGIVGCGDRMRGGDLPAFQAHAKDMNFQIVAVSDIWRRRREEGAAYIQKFSGDRKST